MLNSSKKKLWSALTEEYKGIVKEKELEENVGWDGSITILKKNIQEVQELIENNSIKKR